MPVTGLAERWAAAFGGRVPHAAWLVVLPDGRVAAERDADRPFVSASLVKTFVLAAVLAEGVELDARIAVRPERATGGDGVLKLMRLPVELPLRDLLALMIAVSDNVATNAVLDAAGGPDAVNAWLAAQGWATRISGYVGGAGPRAAERPAAAPGLPTRQGLGVTTAREHDAVVTRMASDPVGAALLAAQQDRAGLGRRLREDVPFLHKTGAVGALRHDGGLVPAPGGALRMTVLTDGGPEPEWVDHPALVAMGEAGAAAVEAVLGADALV